MLPEVLAFNQKMVVMSTPSLPLVVMIMLLPGSTRGRRVPVPQGEEKCRPLRSRRHQGGEKRR
jgi:hypothetical protein